jgi:uncharacterized membrane protein
VTRSARVHARTAFIAACCVGVALVAHLTIIERFPAAIGAALCLVPLAAIGFLVLRRAAHAGVIALAIVAAAAVLWLAWSGLERRFTDLLFAEHLTLNLALALAFGRTLAAGREPLIARFARVVHEGTLPPEVERYTRRVTVAWTVFFLLVAAASTLLYAAHRLLAWSLLVNVGGPVLMGLMFALEYLVRTRALPHWEHVGMLAGMRAFARHFRARRLEEASR